MIPDMFNKSIRDCTDGTSNTLIVGEISGFIYDTAGGQHDRRPGHWFGWHIGGLGEFSPGNAGLWGEIGPHYSTVTVRYAPNSRVTITGGVWSLLGCGSDSGTLSTDANAANVPLSSFHTGGVQVAMADGTVRFISDNISMNTLTLLAVRDDSQPVGEF
jgi:hypothetical protein